MVLANPMAQCTATEIWEEGEDSLTGMAPSTDHDYLLAFDSVWRFHEMEKMMIQRQIYAKRPRTLVRVSEPSTSSAILSSIVVMLTCSADFVPNCHIIYLRSLSDESVPKSYILCTPSVQILYRS